jgi:hypothetical protein
MNVTYTATLSVREQTVLYLSSLLHHERLRRGTRTGRRSLGCFKQAILVTRWFLDGTRIKQLATDNHISKSTTYTYLHESSGIASGGRVLAGCLLKSPARATITGRRKMLLAC